MSRIPIAVQLYSVREDCERDLAGTLGAVARMGYEGVEFAGYYGRSAEELRGMLDDLGLKVAGTHLGLSQLEGDELARTVEFNRGLGNRNLIAVDFGGRYKGTRAAVMEGVGVLNGIAEKLKAEGMRTGVHTHAHEVEMVDGECAWDLIAGGTGAEVVMQLDLGNAMRAGADPIPLLERWAHRGQTVHLKEHSSTNEKALVGEGEVVWQEVFRICEAVGKTEWYIVEQESYPYPPMQSVERCLQFLRGVVR